MEHRTTAKEWRMGWAFLPQKNKSNVIILNLLRDAVNAKRGSEWRIVYRTSGQRPNLSRRLGAQTYDAMKNKRAHIVLPDDLEGQLYPRS
jgi:hypothetical protein